MKNDFKKITVGAIFVLGLNLFILDVFFLRTESPDRIPSPVSTTSNLPQKSSVDQKIKLSEIDLDTCDEECKSFLKENLPAPTFPPIGGIETTSISQPVYLPPSVVITKTDKKETVINILDSGGNPNTGWNDLSGSDFSLNLRSYKNVTKVSLLANLKVFQGNGRAVLRLFNVTDGVPLLDSEISTSSEDFVPVESGAINMPKVSKTYRLQVKSLTGYDARVNAAKLKIVSE